jgi:HEPN domain-containing protein
MHSINTRHVGKADIPKYFGKALRFSESMYAAFSEGNWDATGLLAVHAVISANDALTASRANIRSAGPKHDHAVRLFLRYFTDGESEEVAKDLRWLIGKKSLVEYEARAFTVEEAQEAVERAGRFLEFARRRLPALHQK